LPHPIRVSRAKGEKGKRLIWGTFQKETKLKYFLLTAKDKREGNEFLGAVSNAIRAERRLGGREKQQSQDCSKKRGGQILVAY